jgi:uncharacterized protein YgfB (UPF0149 family)
MPGLEAHESPGTHVATHFNYDQLQRLMHDAHAHAEAAEAHGTLAGALCAAPGYRLEDWLAEILPDGAAGADAEAELAKLFDETRSALLEAQLELQLLIPDDDQALASRTEALALWCNGFLYGLGTNGSGDPAELPGDAGEVVRDFTEISRAGVDDADGPEANEEALAHLVEFVRMGVQLVCEELGVLRAPAPPPPPVGSTSIH